MAIDAYIGLEALYFMSIFRKQLALIEPTVVPRGGLEPPRLAAPDFESGTSTNSITEAGVCSGNSAYFDTFLLLRHESVTKKA